MGFRYDGVAWDGQRWVASLAIQSLGNEVDSITPRPTASDGTVAGKRHDQNSPTSDHTPKPATGLGTVRAIDMSVTAEQGTAISERLRQSADVRLRYVIHNRRMFSSYSKNGVPAFTWREYSGANGHLTHIHASVWPMADDSGGPWGIADVRFEGVGEEVTVEQLQEMLNLRGADPQLEVDGELGPLTMAEWASSGGVGPVGPKGDPGEVPEDAVLQVVGKWIV